MDEIAERHEDNDVRMYREEIEHESALLPQQVKRMRHLTVIEELKESFPKLPGLVQQKREGASSSDERDSCDEGVGENEARQPICSILSPRLLKNREHGAPDLKPVLMVQQTS